MKKLLWILLTISTAFCQDSNQLMRDKWSEDTGFKWFVRHPHFPNAWVGVSNVGGFKPGMTLELIGLQTGTPAPKFSIPAPKNQPAGLPPFPSAVNFDIFTVVTAERIGWSDKTLIKSNTAAIVNNFASQTMMLQKTGRWVTGVTYQIPNHE